MEPLDLEAQGTDKPKISDRFKALWTSMRGKKAQGFTRLGQEDASPELEEVFRSAGKISGLRWCPEEDAGFFSTYLYSFCSGLIKIGYRKPLVQEDLWDVCRQDEAISVCSKFDRIFEETKDRSTLKHGSVLLTMWRANYRRFLLIGAIKFVDNTLVFASPLLLEQLLLCLQEGKSKGLTLLLAFGIFMVGFVETLLNNRQMHYSMRMTMHLKSQMIGMLYSKSLRLHSSARNEFGTGAIVNLQSNDAQKLWWLPLFMHVLWSAPLQIVVVCFLLIRVMGFWPAIAGLATTFLLIPASSFVGRRLAKARKAVVGHTDARVKLTTEVLLGIRAIKLYSWEGPFVDRIVSLRDRELASIRVAAINNAYNTMLFLGGPMFISLAAFTVYGALGYQLTAAVAFPALSLFNLLRFPLMMLPEQILNLIQGRVALTRVQNFMNAEEMIQEPYKPAAPPGKTAVKIRDGSFGWEKDGDALLKSINFEASSGQLIIVIGEVGSGKSSLLCALLGEMLTHSGEVTLAGRVAYTSQDPWICNATLRENILMGASADEQRYNACLDACALRPDLAELSGGDSAEIGEKGVNLSGGQRARVSFARACYTDADTYLLDDPLSAVDSHVGQHLFQECLCNLLGSKTRILVTHQLQFLPAADKIVILSHGEISQVGTYTELVEAGIEFRKFAVEEGSVSGSEESDVEDTNMAHVADAILGNGYHQHANDAASLSHPEESAVGIPAEALESTALNISPEPCPSALDDPVDDHISEPNTSHLGNGFHPTVESHHPATLSQSQNSMDLGSAPQWIFSDEERRKSNGLASTASPFLAEKGRRKSGALPSLVAVIETAASADSVDVSFIRRSIDLSRAGSTKSRPRQSLDISRAASGKSRTASGRLGRAGSSGPPKLPAKIDFGRIVEKEERSTGGVEVRMYKAYLRSWSKVGYLLPTLLVVVAAVERGMQVGQNYWLSVWTDTTTAKTAAHELLDNRLYITVYFLLGSIPILVQGGRLLILVMGSINATRVLHKNLLEKIVRLPLSFFSSQPTGRLLNRFARDTEAVDSKVPNALGSFLNCLVNVVGSLFINLVVTPLVIVPLIPMAWVYNTIRRRFVTTNREIKRLDSLAMSPIFGAFSETLQGLISVRAFRLQSRFGERHNKLLDASSQCWWPLVTSNRWLSVRLETIGNALVFCTAVAAAMILSQSAGLAGLAITAALNLTGLMNWTVRQSTELEVQMNSVERILAYTNEYEAEKPAIVSHKRPPQDWPSKGQILFDNLVVKYRPELPPVLKGLSLKIEGGHKIGVAGRTGGGKSTLMMALFRIVEPTSGKIFIDSLDITEMGLFDLRSRLALVPQDPVVFSGSIRANLDPFDSIEGDARIWQALEQAGLQQTIANLPGGLDADIAEGGSNLSTGQRQLLCMARALLRQAQILVLDEATSSIDNDTDNLIQATVRTAFAKCTVLTVAHRLHTIADCDQILVLDAGSVKEYDSPTRLLKDPTSAFYGLVAETTRQRNELGM